MLTTYRLGYKDETASDRQECERVLIFGEGLAEAPEDSRGRRLARYSAGSILL